MSTDARYHTAEHIVTHAVGELYGGVIGEVHFKGKKVRADYKLDSSRIDTDEFINRIEKRANEIASMDLEVSYVVVSRDDAEKIVSLHKIPDDKEEVRLVKIGEIDATPCSGNHVNNTAEVGFIEVRTCREIEPGMLRLTFMLK